MSTTQIFPVSTEVNNVRNRGARLIEPAVPDLLGRDRQDRCRFPVPVDEDRRTDDRATAEERCDERRVLPAAPRGEAEDDREEAEDEPELALLLDDRRHAPAVSSAASRNVVRSARISSSAMSCSAQVTARTAAETSYSTSTGIRVRRSRSLGRRAARSCGDCSGAEDAERPADEFRQSAMK